jgi:DNA polymerase elongation subunit (family B)
MEIKKWLPKWTPSEGDFGTILNGKNKMIKKEDIKKILYFDVETAGRYRTHEDMVLENLRLAKLWEKRAKYFRGNSPGMEDLTDAEIYSQKAGLEPEFGRVVCVSFGVWDESGSHRMTSFYGENETEILEKSAKILANAAAKGMKICGHNIKMFDIPFLGKRMMFSGLNIPSNLQVWDKKPWEIPILDTAEFFSFGSWSQKFLGLDLLACSLGIDSPKEDIDGSQVHKTYWEDKEHEKIKEYCERDVSTVMDILKKVSR